MKKIVFIFASVCIIFSVLAVSCFAVDTRTTVDFNYQINLKYSLSSTVGVGEGYRTAVLPGTLYVHSGDNYYQFTNHTLHSIDDVYYNLYDSMKVSAKDTNAYYYLNYGITCEYADNGYHPYQNLLNFHGAFLQNVLYVMESVSVPYIVCIDDDGTSIDLTNRYVKYSFSTMEPVTSGADGGYTYQNIEHTVINSLNGYSVPLLPDNVTSDYGISGLACIYNLKLEILDQYQRVNPVACKSINVAYPSNRLVTSRQSEFASAYSARLLNVYGDEPSFEFDFSLTEFISNSIQPLLDIQFAPWLTLGDCIFVVISFALFIIFLKIFAGG